MAAAPFDAPLERLLTPFDRALLREHRRSLLTGAAGRVLELGSGSGGQIELYPALRVEDVTLVGTGAGLRAPVGRARPRVRHSTSTTPAPSTSSTRRTTRSWRCSC